jgi:pyrroloquinoline quinone biosynthesis protein D
MARPLDTSQPRFAAGCRWGGSDTERMVLYPEGMIKLEGPGRRILEACDGERTFLDIVEELQSNFSASDPARIREDVGNFLESLQQKRIIDY